MSELTAPKMFELIKEVADTITDSLVEHVGPNVFDIEVELSSSDQVTATLATQRPFTVINLFDSEDGFQCIKTDLLTTTDDVNPDQFKAYMLLEMTDRIRFAINEIQTAYNKGFNMFKVEPGTYKLIPKT